MTKKDFVLVAAVIAALPVGMKAEVAAAFAAKFEKEFPLFKTAVFLKACLK